MTTEKQIAANRRNGVKLFDHEKIKQLLSEGLKPTEVARAVGCTRERVRQLDLRYFGTTGRQRALEKRFERSIVPPEAPFVIEARARGFTVEGIALTAFRPSTRMVLVNGFTVNMHKAIRRPLGNNVYWQIRRGSTVVDFYAWSCPGGFIIIPFDQQPRAETMLAINRKRKSGAYSKRHDYINYLNNWDQLKGGKHENLKAS